MGTVIVMTSGKGGTGKTTCTAAVSSALAMLGNKTICLDCDIGLKNLDLVLGLADTTISDFSDVLSGNMSLTDAAVEHHEIKNLWFLSAPSGLSPEDINPNDMGELISTIRSEFDYCIIDCPAGLGAGFKLAVSFADMAIVVTTGDATSLRDGQKTVAELHRIGMENVRLIVNRLNPRMLRRIKSTVDDAIDNVGAQLIGLVSDDESVALAANLEKPLMLFGAKYAFDQFKNIARRITGEKIPVTKR